MGERKYSIGEPHLFITQRDGKPPYIKCEIVGFVNHSILGWPCYDVMIEGHYCTDPSSRSGEWIVHEKHIVKIPPKSDDIELSTWQEVSKSTGGWIPPQIKEKVTENV